MFFMFSVFFTPLPPPTEHKHRRKLLNEVETLKGSIRVLCRIRPMSRTEVKNGHRNAITFPPRKKGALVITKTDTRNNSKKEKFYEFDTTFQPNATQEQVAAQVMPLVQSAIDGFNVCIFAYGQTGSGKTYTMTGADGGKLDKDNTSLYGITPRSIVELFNISKSSGHHNITFAFSMVELYKGELLDLFVDKRKKKKTTNKENNKSLQQQQTTNKERNNTDDTKLSVKRDPATGVVHIENVQKISVESPEALHDLIKKGNDCRHTSKTNMNDTSSRSHLVMTIYCESKNNTSGITTSGKLNLVDLAGSERQSKTGASGDTFEESKSINKSLSVRRITFVLRVVLLLCCCCCCVVVVVWLCCCLLVFFVVVDLFNMVFGFCNK
jgi:kinesin family protein C2/C3